MEGPSRGHWKREGIHTSNCGSPHFPRSETLILSLLPGPTLDLRTQLLSSDPSKTLCLLTPQPYLLLCSLTYYPAQALNIHLSKPITIPALSPEGPRS